MRWLFGPGADRLDRLHCTAVGASLLAPGTNATQSQQPWFTCLCLLHGDCDPTLAETYVGQQASILTTHNRLCIGSVICMSFPTINLFHPLLLFDGSGNHDDDYDDDDYDDDYYDDDDDAAAAAAGKLAPCRPRPKCCRQTRHLPGRATSPASLGSESPSTRLP